MDFNSVTIVGRLTRDPQLKYLPSQTAVCDFGMAVNRKYKGTNDELIDETTFVDVSAFSKTAETITRYVKKGDCILISGRLKFDQWVDKTDGGKRSKLSVVAEMFQFGPKSSGGNSQAGGNESNQELPKGDDSQIPDEDIPF